VTGEHRATKEALRRNFTTFEKGTAPILRLLEIRALGRWALGGGGNQSRPEREEGLGSDAKTSGVEQKGTRTPL